MSPDRPLLLILRALKLGDYLTAVPALRALGAAFPDHRRVLLAPDWLEPLASHVRPSDEFRAHSGLLPIPADLFGADVSVDLHGAGPGSQPLLLAAAPRRLIAFAHRDLPQTWGAPTWLPNEHEVERWCRLLRENAIAADPGALQFRPPAIAVDPAYVGATLLHPGAASMARRWPLERFAAVGQFERDRGRAVVITGGSEEGDLVDELAGHLGESVGRLHDTGLLELAAVIGAAGAVVCGDTGIAHLATALDTPSVVLHGPIGPHLWGAPTGDPRHIALWAGRSGDPHADVVDPGLLSISVREATHALKSLDRFRHPSPTRIFQQRTVPI